MRIVDTCAVRSQLRKFYKLRAVVAGYGFEYILSHASKARTCTLNCLLNRIRGVEISLDPDSFSVFRRYAKLRIMSLMESK